MGDVSREQENRELAEWLEPMPMSAKPLNSRAATIAEHGLVALSALGAWWRHVGSCWEPRDFRNDEAANALLLEKMRCPRLMKRITHGKRYVWHCYANIQQGFAEDPDRRTAVVLAALAHLRGKEEHER